MRQERMPTHTKKGEAQRQTRKASLSKGWVPEGWVQTKAGYGQRWVPGAHFFIREHIEQAAAQQLASDISHKSIGQRACIPLRPVPLRPTLYGIPSSAPPRQ